MQLSQITFKYLWLNKSIQLNGPLDTKTGVGVDASQTLFRQQKLLTKTEKRHLVVLSWLLFACLSVWKTTQNNEILRKCWQWNRWLKFGDVLDSRRTATFNPWPLIIEQSTLWCNLVLLLPICSIWNPGYFSRILCLMETCAPHVLF